MRFSLPLIFILQTALLIGAMVGIITSFVVVTNDSIATAVENSIENNLNTFAESVNTIVQETEPVAKQYKRLATDAWAESGRNRGDASHLGLADFNRSLSVAASHLELNRQVVYVYESFEMVGVGSGRWGELSAGYADGVYFFGSTNRSNFDAYAESPAEGLFPLDLTVIDEYDYDPTEEDYIQIIRNMTAAAGHNVTGLWHPPSVWYDDVTETNRALLTYSFPAMFDPVDGHTISGYSVDVDVVILSTTLSNLARQNNLLYLVDVPTLAMIVSSKPTTEVPVIDYSTNEDGEWFTVPETASVEINAGMRMVLDHAGGAAGLRAESGFHVLSLDDTIVSYRHVQDGTLHWIAVDHTPRDFYFGEARRVSTILIIVAVVVLCICLAVCVVVYLAVVTPINNLATSMDRISKLEPTSEESLESPALTELQPMHTAFVKLDVALKSFTRYVPRGVVKELIDSNQLCKLAMMPRQCSILFSDIAGFTSISERVPAAQLSRLIHTYFNRMSRIVMEHNGMIDKFIGDCIMAVWGAPMPQEHHELRATLAGMLLELEARSDPLATDFDEVGELLSIRVGVNSGDVLAGNMGSDERMNYTVIGDNVNLSSRLEAFNKSMGTRVMVSAGTVAGLQDKVVLRLLCRVAVVGKDEPVAVYEARGLDGSQSTKLTAATYDRFAAMDQEDMCASLMQMRSNEYAPSTAVLVEQASVGSDSEMSIVSGDHDVLKEHRATSLLKAGRNKLICEAQEVDFARRYTEAARLFMRNECGEALQHMAKLKAEFPTLMDDCAAEYLEGAASKQLKTPDSGFDAVFRQTEK